MVRGVARVVLRTLGAHHLVEAGRQVTLPLVVGVLIDQRGLLGALSVAEVGVERSGPGAGPHRLHPL